MEARLAVRTAEERVRALSGRADQLLRAAATERETRARLQERRRSPRPRRRVAAAVVAGRAGALTRIAASLEVASPSGTPPSRPGWSARASCTRCARRSRELAGELDRLTDAVHRDEVARAEQRLRIEQLETAAVEQYGVDLDALVAEYGPDQLVPPSAADLARAEADGKQPPEPPVRPGRAGEAGRAGRARPRPAGQGQPAGAGGVRGAGGAARVPVHPAGGPQGDPPRPATVVKEVDDRVHRCSPRPSQDTAREFEIVFRTLFPGGEGRLVLTDPDDLLATGIEVEARPPGKKVKRLSLLSGGERSLTAVALLVAIFRARPSPFYVLDEVEAALDDTNLGRLLELIEELR